MSELEPIEGVVYDADGNATYWLEYPAADRVSITLRRPKVSDLLVEDSAETKADADCALIARLSDKKLTVAEVETEIDGLDFTVLNTIVQRFLEEPPPIADGALANLEITFNPDGSAVCPLATPRTSEKELLQSINLRRLTPADIKASASGRGAHARSVMLLSRLSNVPQITIRSLDGYDYARINRVARDFLTKRRGTGANP